MEHEIAAKQADPDGSRDRQDDRDSRVPGLTGGAEGSKVHCTGEVAGHPAAQPRSVLV